MSHAGDPAVVPHMGYALATTKQSLELGSCLTPHLVSLATVHLSVGMVYHWHTRVSVPDHKDASLKSVERRLAKVPRGEPGSKSSRSPWSATCELNIHA